MLFSVYTKEVEDDYFFHQDELLALKKALDEDPYVQSTAVAWFEGYSLWLQNESPYTNDLVSGSAPDPVSFNRWLAEYLDGSGAIFRDAVVFGGDVHHPRVVSSKLDGVTVDIVDGPQSIDVVDSIRESIDSSAPSLSPVAYAYPFLSYDGLRSLAKETARNILLATAAVFVVNLVLLADFVIAVIVVSMVALTDFMLFANIWYLGLSLNFVTSICIIFAVGLSVDYSSHIAHCFLSTAEGSRVTRATKVLTSVGSPIAAGALTTGFSIVFLGFASYYPFGVFFKMLTILVLLGIWHGIVLLPVILTFAGTDLLQGRT